MGINEGREHAFHWCRPNQLHHVKTYLVDDEDPQVKETNVPQRELVRPVWRMRLRDDANHYQDGPTTANTW